MNEEKDEFIDKIDSQIKASEKIIKQNKTSLRQLEKAHNNIFKEFSPEPVKQPEKPDLTVIKTQTDQEENRRKRLSFENRVLNQTRNNHSPVQRPEDRRSKSQTPINPKVNRDGRMFKKLGAVFQDYFVPSAKLINESRISNNSKAYQTDRKCHKSANMSCNSQPNGAPTTVMFAHINKTWAAERNHEGRGT